MRAIIIKQFRGADGLAIEKLPDPVPKARSVLIEVKAFGIGWLGGLDPVNNFNPLLQMPSGVYFTFFASFAFGTPEFPVSDIPLQSLVDKVAAGVSSRFPMEREVRSTQFCLTRIFGTFSKASSPRTTFGASNQILPYTLMRGV
jgi:hypothetical protein